MDKLSETWSVFVKDKENNNLALLAFQNNKLSRGTNGVKEIIRIKNWSEK